MKPHIQPKPVYGNFTITDTEILAIQQSERGLLYAHVINLSDVFPDQAGYAWALFYKPPDSLYFDVLDSETLQLKVYSDAATLCGAVSGFGTNNSFSVPTLTDNHVIPLGHLKVAVN